MYRLSQSGAVLCTEAILSVVQEKTSSQVDKFKFYTTHLKVKLRIYTKVDI